jgi:hypothetical protein
MITPIFPNASPKTCRNSLQKGLIIYQLFFLRHTDSPLSYSNDHDRDVPYWIFHYQILGRDVCVHVHVLYIFFKLEHETERQYITFFFYHEKEINQ